MDESFRRRVEKVFGSLTSSFSSSQQATSCLQSTLWSLTGNEADQLACSSSSSFDDFVNGADDDYEYNTRSGGMSFDDADEWDIRSSDSILDDNEEEEDDYDEVASSEGETNTNTDRHCIDNNADDMAAANIRVQEDDAQAKDKEVCVERKQPFQLKSILKRKGSNSDSKSPKQKRVSFDPAACKIVCKEEASELKPASNCRRRKPVNVNFIPRNKLSQLKAVILKAVMDNKRIERQEEAEVVVDDDYTAIASEESNQSEEAAAVSPSVASSKASPEYPTNSSKDEYDT